MRLRNLRAIGVLATLTLMVAAGRSVPAQQIYHNVVNTRFRTVSDGPQSAIILDVDAGADASTVRTAALQRVRALNQARLPSVRRKLALLAKRGRRRRAVTPFFVDTVIVRRNGQLALPREQVSPRQAGNSLTFQIDTTSANAFPSSDATNLAALINLIYQGSAVSNPSMQTVYGPPAWSGTVNVENSDPTLGSGIEPLGAVLILTSKGGGAFTVEMDYPASFIELATQGDYSDAYMAMAQVMAQAFHGPALIAYDAWEKGMARAAAMACAVSQQGQFPSGATVDPNGSFFYTPEYDLLNQPALGNNTWEPPTLVNSAYASGNSGMLLARMQMASTAWLKCYIENQTFFSAFNSAYYAAFASDPTVANDATRLSGYAAAAVPTVELLPFQTWYEQQYALDTSVTAGRKLYVDAAPTVVELGQGDTNSGATIDAVYYDTSATGDETPMSGAGSLIYWDYTGQNQLSLAVSDSSMTLTGGVGSVSPIFNGVGASYTNPVAPMRLAADLFVGPAYARVLLPVDALGTSTTPSDFAGVVSGANSGTLQVQFTPGTTIIPTFVNGAFGAYSGGIPSGYSKAVFNFTPTGGNSAIKYQRNTAFNNTTSLFYAGSPVFVLSAASPGGTVTLSHTFSPGPQMISLPIQPTLSNMATVLGVPSATALLAQYRQDLNGGGGQYQQYPTLPLYEPGYSLWSDFPASVTASSITGRSDDLSSNVAVALEYGWNQIGAPFSGGPLSITANSLTNDLWFDYGGTVADLADAVTYGWVATGIMGYDPSVGYYDITSASPPTVNGSPIPSDELEVWKGYWINNKEPDGLTVIYLNPNTAVSANARRSLRAKSHALAATRSTSGWRLALKVKDQNGNETSGVLGESPIGSQTYVPMLDVASPPAFTSLASLGVRFLHSEWDTGQKSAGGQFLSDIRPLGSNSEWDIVVNVPKPGQAYTLNWPGTALLPRGLRLTLTDTVTGSTTVMNNASSLTFTAGQTENSRQFKIAAQPASLGRLRIESVVARLQASKGRSPGTANISFESSLAAQANVVISSGARTLRHLASGRAVQSGTNEVVWDMKDDHGRVLPLGVYTVQVTGQTPDGDQTRATASFVISR